jgi:hypothetical protein
MHENKFRFLAAKVSAQTAQLSSVTVLPVLVSVEVADTMISQLTKCLSKVQQQLSPMVDLPSTSAAATLDTDTLQFWDQNTSLLAPLAQDVACMIASQAFVDQAFSPCFFMLTGCRRHMKNLMEIRVFLNRTKTLWILLDVATCSKSSYVEN